MSGKGPEAAALTSLTRHTLRAAALREMDPRENLELLNDALWSQPDSTGALLHRPLRAGRARPTAAAPT